MEQLNNKIKDIYNKEHTPLPDELKWDEMKEGIFEKMENQDDEPAPFFVFTNGVKFLLTLIFLFFVATTVYYLANNFENKKTNRSIKNTPSNPFKNKSTTSNSVEKELKIKSDNENKSTKTPNNLIVKNKPVHNSVSQKINDVKVKQPIENNTLAQANISDILSPKNNPSILNYNRLKTNNNTLIVNRENKKTFTKNSEQQSIIEKESKNILTEDQKIIANINSDNKGNEVVNPLTKKSSFLKSSIEKHAVLIRKTTETPIAKKHNKKKQSYHILQIDGGFTYLLSQYKKSDSKQYQTETGFPSNYIGINYSRIFTNGLYLSVGLNFNRFKTKFELSDTIIHNYEIKDALTKRIRNVYTNDIIRNVYNTVETPALSKREVRHYNRFDAISIPLIIGNRFQHKKLTYHIGIGSDISILNRSEGKTLRENVVITYSKLETEHYHNGIRIAALAEAGIGLSITSHMEIAANFRYKKHLQNWSTDKLVVKPHVFLLGTGVKFKF